MIAWRPLTPRLVAAVLGMISGQERARWSKDGRLPTSGPAHFRRASTIAVPTYSVAVIERLLASPEILAAWRDQDVARKVSTRHADLPTIHRT